MCSSECKSVAQICHRDASVMKEREPVQSYVACLKHRSARGWLQRVSKFGSDRRKEVRSEASMCQGAGPGNELGRISLLQESRVRSILVPAYSHYKLKTLS